MCRAFIRRELTRFKLYTCAASKQKLIRGRSREKRKINKYTKSGRKKKRKRTKRNEHRFACMREAWRIEFNLRALLNRATDILLLLSIAMLSFTRKLNYNIKQSEIKSLLALIKRRPSLNNIMEISSLHWTSSPSPSPSH